MPTCKDLTIVCSNPEGASPALDCSSVFRVEKLEGNCVPFRVLEPNTNNESGCFDEWPSTLIVSLQWIYLAYVLLDV